MEEQIKYEYIGHKPIRLGNTGLMWCWTCGLVYLKNSISIWSIAKGCDSRYHPEYKNKLRQLTGLK